MEIIKNIYCHVYTFLCDITELNNNVVLIVDHRQHRGLFFNLHTGLLQCRNLTLFV